jgi:hypothetical protein
MSRIGFLRRQAEFCLRTSQSCGDPKKAEQLRLLAAEYFRMATDAKPAAAAEDKSQDPPPRHAA